MTWKHFQNILGEKWGYSMVCTVWWHIFIEHFSCSWQCAKAFLCKIWSSDSPYFVDEEIEVQKIWGNPLSKWCRWALNVVSADSSTPAPCPVLPVCVAEHTWWGASDTGSFMRVSVDKDLGHGAPVPWEQWSRDGFISFYFPLVSNYSIMGLDCFWNQK